MPFEDYLKLAVNYGLGLILALFGAFASWKIINRVFDENTKRDERIALVLDGSLKGLCASVDRLAQMMVTNDQRQMSFYTSIAEANKFQREEHQNMVKSLDIIAIKLEA